MVDKTIYFDGEDDKNLNKRKNHRQDGMVYAHVGGVSNFVHISQVPIKELDGKTFGEVVKDLIEQVKLLKEDNIKIREEYKNHINQMKGGVAL